MEDGELIKDMFNDPDIENLVGGWAFPLSMFTQERWMEMHNDDQGVVRFVIDTEEDGKIDVLTLTDIDWKNRRAAIGVKIASN